MKKYMSIIILAAISSLVGFAVGYLFFVKVKSANPQMTPKVEKPLEKYTILNLSQTTIPPGKLEIEENFFKLTFAPALDGVPKTVTGQVNQPTSCQKCPLIIMLRGYVDQKIYTSGTGTRRAAEVFAQNGYLTLAPDFLGYAGSDTEAADIFESRFQTYTTVLALLSSLDQIPAWDRENIFLWGHSNGGQIALTVLEITGTNYPTTLWAPVSRPFPYSVLYYTDESTDRGKFIRRELAEFEKLYDPDQYSLDLYLDRIRAPLQLHQGTADDAIPAKWSQELKTKLLDLGLDLKYYEYPGADHNLQPAWNSVIQRDIVFFNSHLK